MPCSRIKPSGGVRDFIGLMLSGAGQRRARNGKTGRKLHDTASVEIQGPGQDRAEGSGAAQARGKAIAPALMAHPSNPEYRRGSR